MLHTRLARKRSKTTGTRRRGRTIPRRGWRRTIGDSLYYELYYRDFPYVRLANGWNDTMGGFSDTKKYVVETSPKVVERCILMTTDPGDLVFDPTCGSGTTAYVAEQMESPAESPIPQLQAGAGQDDLARRGLGEGRIVNPAADHITTMIELLRRAGVNFPGRKKLVLENLRPLGVGWLHAEAEAKQNGEKTRRVAVKVIDMRGNEVIRVLPLLTEKG